MGLEFGFWILVFGDWGLRFEVFGLGIEAWGLVAGVDGCWEFKLKFRGWGFKDRF